MSLPTDHGLTGRVSTLVIASLLVLVITYSCLSPSSESVAFFRLQRSSNATDVAPKDELETALERAAMVNKTLIIAVLNKAYVEENGMLDVFLRSLREGEDTESLIRHFLFVAVDQTAFNKCKALELHCYQLDTGGVDLSREVFYMSENFINMMWQRTLFLGNILRRGYSFIFTDMDVMWLRNPFAKLSYDGEDMQISCDFYNGRPFDDSNFINTGFYFVASNNRTIALFDEWYASRNNSAGMKEQDVLAQMKSQSAFRRLGMKVRFLDTAYFSGFCQESRDFSKVTTVHANCCCSVKAKLIDLKAILEVWKTFNGTSRGTWPERKGCIAKKNAASKDELETALQEASMANKTLIISILNKKYAEKNGMLDLFLQSLREGEDTDFLIRHLLLVAVDQTAFNRCQLLKLHCYQLDAKGTDFSKEQFYMSDGFIKMMWQRTLLLGDILRRGYNFIFTDMDVMWLRNPFAKLNHDGEDMQISCDFYNGRPLDDSNFVNTGFYFVASNNRTIALFDEWYASRNNSTGMKEQDVLARMKSQGAFRRLGMKVRFLDTAYFSGFCQESKNFSKVTTVHANCCCSVKAKLIDLKAILEVWKTFDGTSRVTWPERKGCIAKKNAPTKDELETALQEASMANKTLIISMLNKKYVEKNGMLDLFLQSLREGEGTEFLIRHLLLVAVDQTAFNWCQLLKLHCYQLDAKGTDFSKEQFYMSDGFIKMMWQRTLLLGDILRRGYNFIFTDMDVMWLRNPFAKLNHDGEDMQISCDFYNGRPLDDSNFINTGFYFVASNNRTIALFDEWYASRNNSTGMKEQDVLARMKSQGAFRRLGMKVRFLDTAYFSGFCQDSKDFRKVTTVHANCCGGVQSKLIDLKAVLEVWKASNGILNVTMPEHKACTGKIDIASKDELETTLQEASMANKTLIIAVLDKAYMEENGMLDLFLRSLREGEETKFLIRHLLLVAVDQTAFDRCKLLKLHCYRLITKSTDFSKEQLYMNNGFIKMMWQRIAFLRDVLKHGYSFIFTDMDVMWLRNPFTKLNHDGDDLQISCDAYNGKPLDDSNPINTGFYFVASNNKTIALFDAWYASSMNSAGMKDQYVLSAMKSKGIFKQLGMKVRFLDTLYFSGFCQDSRDFKEVTTVHANCCRSLKAKHADLTAVLEVWKNFNATTMARWSEHKACAASWIEDSRI